MCRAIQVALDSGVPRARTFVNGDPRFPPFRSFCVRVGRFSDEPTLPEIRKARADTSSRLTSMGNRRGDLVTRNIPPSSP